MTSQTEIRTDLWHTMTVGDLLEQQTMLIDRMNAVMDLQARMNTPSIQHMRAYLEQALTAINLLINK